MSPTGKSISVSVRVVRAGEAKLRGHVSEAIFSVARADRGNLCPRVDVARPVCGGARPVPGAPR